MDTDLEFGFMCCPKTCMSFKRYCFPPQLHERTSLSSVGGAGLPALWGSHFGRRLSGLSTRTMVQSVLPACLLFLPVKDNQAEFFHIEVPLCSLPGMDQASPAVFPFPQAKSSALCLGLQLLYFIFPGSGERRK